MKISPVPSMATTAPTPTDPQVSRVESIRALKMNTNRTPEQYIPPPDQTTPDAAAVEKMPISDTNEPTATREATQPLSPQFAKLAKERRALQVKERELLDKEKAIQAMSQGSDKVDLARLKSEPLSVLLEAGVTYDQLTEAILGNPVNPEINALKAEIAALKGDVDKKFVDKETQAEQQVLAEMRKEATLIASQGEDFELVRETKSIPDVMRLIEKTYRESGEVLEVREALKLVEDYLFDQAKTLANLKKVQSQMSPPAQPPVMQRPQGMRTLTNKDTASVPMTAKQRALAAFYGTLKK